MSLIEALLEKYQYEARAAIKAGDEVLITYYSRAVGPSSRIKKVSSATAKYLVVEGMKYHRKNGKQVGAKKSQAVHYNLYALTQMAKEEWEKLHNDTLQSSDTQDA